MHFECKNIGTKNSNIRKRFYYQDDAFAEMIDGGGGERVSSGFEWRIVVICGDRLEREVVYAVFSEDSGEARFGVADCVGGGQRVSARDKEVQ